MNSNDNPIPFGQGRITDDPLTEIARDGARRMLAAALTTEADDFVAALSAERLSDGRRRVVRHGAGPERLIQTGIGPLEVRRPKVRDRCGDGSGRIRFSSAILPRWARRSPSLDALLPVLYLRGEDLHWRLPGGSGGDPRPRGPQSLPRRDLPPDRRMGQGARRVAAPRPVHAGRRIYLGRRRLSPGPDGAGGGMHARRHRGHS